MPPWPSSSSRSRLGSAQRISLGSGASKPATRLWTSGAAPRADRSRHRGQRPMSRASGGRVPPQEEHVEVAATIVFFSLSHWRLRRRANHRHGRKRERGLSQCCEQVLYFLVNLLFGRNGLRDLLAQSVPITIPLSVDRHLDGAF